MTASSIHVDIPETESGKPEPLPMDFLGPGFSLVLHTILRVAGFLALLSLLQTPRTETPPAAQAAATVLLIVLGGFLLVSFRMESLENDLPEKTPLLPELWRRFSILVPLFFLGLLLPFPWIVPYLLTLAILDFQCFLVDLRRRTFLPGPISTIADRRTGLRQPAFSEIDETEEFEEEETDFEASQQLVRHRTVEGKDRLEGTFLVEYPENQWTATIHVPFCPPFDAVPGIEVFLLDEVEAKINIVKRLPSGVRIDVKRISAETRRLRIVVTAEEA